VRFGVGMIGRGLEGNAGGNGGGFRVPKKMSHLRSRSSSAAQPHSQPVEGVDDASGQQQRLLRLDLLLAGLRVCDAGQILLSLRGGDGEERSDDTPAEAPMSSRCGTHRGPERLIANPLGTRVPHMQRTVACSPIL